MEREKALRVAGLALLGLGGVMALSKSSGGSTTPPAPAPAPAPSPAPAPTPTSSHQGLAAWLALRRPDIVAGLQQHRWEDVFGQYLREAWPEFVARPDIVPGPWNEKEGEWLKENARVYWLRADVQAAWFGYPAPVLLASGYFGDSAGKETVIGEYLIENGAAAILAGR